MEGTCKTGVVEPAGDLANVTGEKISTNKFSLTMPSGPYMWKKEYPMRSFHWIISVRTAL